MPGPTKLQRSQIRQERMRFDAHEALPACDSKRARPSRPAEWVANQTARRPSGGIGSHRQSGKTEGSGVVAPRVETKPRRHVVDTGTVRALRILAFTMVILRRHRAYRGAGCPESGLIVEQGCERTFASLRV